jgi:hypothetical protein
MHLTEVSQVEYINTFLLYFTLVLKCTLEEYPQSVKEEIWVVQEFIKGF